MSPFTPKAWLDGRENGASARWNAAAAIDMETRLAAYADSVSGGIEVVSPGTVTTNQTLDMTNRREVLWVVTAGANIKLEIGGWSAANCVTLIVKQDATGSRGVQMPTAKWDGGSIPVTSTAPNAIDIRAFLRGTTETYGFESGTAMA